MVGILSFLALVCVIVCVVDIALLVVRTVKKKPRKPIAIMAAVSCVLFMGLCVAVSAIYEPPEKPAPAVSEIADTAPAPSAGSEDTEPEKPAPVVSPAPSETLGKEETLPVSPGSESAEKKPDPAPPVMPEDDKTSTEAKPEQSEPAPTESADAPAESEPDFVEAHRTDIVVASRMLLDRFISNYKIPMAAQLWTIAKFDDAGAVVAMVDVTEKSSGKTEAAIVVLSPVMENEKMTGATPHFISVGDVVHGDDGYCDDVFSSIAEMFGGSE